MKRLLLGVLSIAGVLAVYIFGLYTGIDLGVEETTRFYKEQVIPGIPDTYPLICSDPFHL